VGKWGFLTNHAHVLIQVAREPRSTVREIALATGITERAAISVLQDLKRSGIVSTRREGRADVKMVNAPVLVAHRPWGASEMEIPDELIAATLEGLAQVGGSNGRSMDLADLSTSEAAGLPETADEGEKPARRWGFLTTHALILIFVTQHPHLTVREISFSVGVTERAAHSALQDLREAGIIERERVGRRNKYSVNFERLREYRREGTAPGLVPGDFVSALAEALLRLHPAA
jgi:DNA-binding transcriptional ArsR family regulator